MAHAQGITPGGQFFTPAPAADFVWHLLNAFADCDLGGSRIIDPAAGEGALLAAGLRLGFIAPELTVGIELDRSLGRIEEAAGATIHPGDGLAAHHPGVEEGSFDVAIGNPPFGRAASLVPSSILECLEAAGRFSLLPSRAAAAKVEQLFLERGLKLVKPGGLVAYIMPDGFLANARAQWARDWVLNQAALLALVSLPKPTFRTSGLDATTSLVLLRRRGGGSRPPARVLLAGTDEPQGDSMELACQLGTLSNAILSPHSGRIRNDVGRQCFRVPSKSLQGSRWDIPFWRLSVRKTVRRQPTVALGDFIELMTYGAIVTGKKPVYVKGGIRVVLQRDFTETGLKGEAVLKVDAGSDWDPCRSRVARGDLLLPRSGAGSLGRNRMAVYLEATPANVGCFVNLIRLVGINPFFVWLFLRSAPGWSQIRSLLNGVGTPNINFSEIRSLRLPVVPADHQQSIERRYLTQVLPWHNLAEQSVTAGLSSRKHFCSLVQEIERVV